MNRYNEFCKRVLDWCEDYAEAIFVTSLATLTAAFVVAVVAALS